MSFILCQEFIDLFKAKQDREHGRRKTQDGSIEKGRFVNADLKREGIFFFLNVLDSFIQPNIQIF